MTLSRSGWLGLSIGLLVVAWYKRAQILRSANLKYFLVALIVIVVFFAQIYQYLYFIISARLEEIESRVIHLYLIKSAFSMFLSHPLTGVGIGNCGDAYGKYFKPGYEYYNAHSAFLTILSETGIIGFIIYTSFYIFIFRQILLFFRNSSGYHKEVIGLGLLSGFCGLMAANIFYQNFTFQFFFVFLGLAFAAGIVASKATSEKVKKAIKNKREKLDLDVILNLDEQRRKILLEAESLRQKRNEFSKIIAQMKKEGKNTDKEIAQMKTVSDRITVLDQNLRDVEQQLEQWLLRVPNVPHPSVPVGEDESANKLVKEWGEIKKLDFKPLPHWELGRILGILDLERASKISGSGFIVFTGKGALLERSLINFMLDLHTQKHGYKEIFPPYLVNRDSMTGTGQLPKLEEDMYLLKNDDYFLIPTAEGPLTNLHRDEILKAEGLPIYYTAYTACFRREAGAYGKATQRMIMVHLFDT